MYYWRVRDNDKKYISFVVKLYFFLIEIKSHLHWPSPVHDQNFTFSELERSLDRFVIVGQILLSSLSQMHEQEVDKLWAVHGVLGLFLPSDRNPAFSHAHVVE